MALHNKRNIKNGFVNVPQFFSLISESLGGVFYDRIQIFSVVIVE